MGFNHSLMASSKPLQAQQEPLEHSLTFFEINKSKAANMCQYKHIKGSVDEPTLLSNAHQRKEKGSSTHETELLHEGLT